MKNGKIEFCRFWFCLAVLFFHLEKYIMGEPSLKHTRFMLFPHGNMGVEFFFLVSGYLLARAAYRAHRSLSPEDRLLSAGSSSDALRFLEKKYLRIFPEHMVAFVITFVVYAVYKGLTPDKIAFSALESIPSFLFLQMSGLRMTDINFVEWYLSAMLLAMAIVYPLCRRWYYGFTRYIFPLLSLIVLGIFYHNTQTMSGVQVWMGMGFKGTIRGVVEIALGTTAFELTRLLSQKVPYSRKTRLLVTVVEWGLLATVTLFMALTLPRRYEFFVLPALFILVVCIASDAGYGQKFFNSPFFYFLGEVSFPVYLSQLSAIYFVNKYLADRTIPVRITFGLLLTFLVALVVYFAAKPLKKVANRIL